MNIERLRKVVNVKQCQIDMAVFDLAQIGLRNAGLLGQSFLRHRTLDSQARDIASDQRANIHKRDCRGFTRQSLFAETNIRSV